MLRFEIREDGSPPLPPIDLDDAVVVIGSDALARIRLPAGEAQPEHVRVSGGRYSSQEASGEVGEGVLLAIGRYRVRISPSPSGAAPTPPQRTESLAKELMRAMLGTDGAPTLEVERGPLVGARRMLAPPESVLVLGRGDGVTWSIVHDDISRTHLEVRRTWDGVRVVDRDSKNGIRVDGTKVREALLVDGALLELGAVQIRFRDPANPAPARPVASPGVATPSTVVHANSTHTIPSPQVPLLFYVAIGIGAAAVIALIALLAT